MIPVTHASGGPLNDIVVPYNGLPTGLLTQIPRVTYHAYMFCIGFHATTPETFAEAFEKVLTMSASEDLDLRVRARTWAVHRFSAEEFEKGWTASGWKSWLPVASKT